MESIQIFYLFVVLLTIFESGEMAMSYDFLIETAYDEYERQGIIIATDRNYFSFEKITIIQELLRKLSARGIGSLVVNFLELKVNMKFQPARSLVVIFLDEITKIHEFKKEIVTIDTSHLVWLLLFTGNNDEDNCEYYRYPTESLFNLSFNTEILVSCCNSSDIAKLSSEKMNYNDSITKFHEIDRHNSGILRNHQQLRNIEEFRVAIVQDSGNIGKSNNQLHGYLGEIVTELARVMNLTISCVNSGTPMWIIDAIISGKADMGVSEFTMTLTRRGLVDFTPTLGERKPKIYYHNPRQHLVQWNSFLKVFHRDVWIVILIFLLITPILLTIIQYTGENSLLDTLCNNYLNVWGIFCQQGSPDVLHGSPVKMIYLTMLISSIIVYASYSAAFIRHLTTSSEYVPFHNVGEFLKHGTHKLIVKKNSTMYEEVFRVQHQQLKELLKPEHFLPTTYEEGFKQVCAEKVALWDHQADQYLRENYVPCRILSFETGGKFHVGMILPLNSKHTKLVKYHIQKFRSTGMIDRLKHKYSKKREKIGISFKSVKFRDILPILTAFAIGCSIALVIFRIENLIID